MNAFACAAVTNSNRRGAFATSCRKYFRVAVPHDILDRAPLVFVHTHLADDRTKPLSVRVKLGRIWSYLAASDTPIRRGRAFAHPRPSPTSSPLLSALPTLAFARPGAPARDARLSRHSARLPAAPATGHTGKGPFE